MWRDRILFAAEGDSAAAGATGSAAAAGATGTAAGGGPGGGDPAPSPGTAAGGKAPPAAGNGAAAGEVAGDVPGWLKQMSRPHREALQTHGLKSVDELAAAFIERDRNFVAAKGGVQVPGEKATADEIKAFHKSIGVPDDGKAYELPSGDGTDPFFVDWARGAFVKHGIPLAAAKGLANDWQGLVAKVVDERNADIQRRLKDEDVTLRAEWKGDYAANIDLTNRVARYLGWSDPVLAAVNEAQGYAATRTQLLKLAHLVAEDGVRPTGGSTFNITTPEHAGQELDRLKRDAAFNDALQNPRHPQHKQANEKWDRLLELKTGVRMPDNMRGR